MGSRDHIRSLHRLIPKLFPNFILLAGAGDAQDLQMCPLGVLPEFGLMLIRLAANGANVAPSGKPLKILNFASQKVRLFAHDYTGCQLMTVS